MIETILEIVDDEFIKDKECNLMGKDPADRAKALLGKLKASVWIKGRVYNQSRVLRHTAHKFMRRGR